MIDLLFVEVGAVVTEILSPTRCTIEPFCNAMIPPKYRPEGRVEVDFALSLESVLSDLKPVAIAGVSPVAIAALRVLYDYGSTPIGMGWPGGGYEGSVCIREDVVKTNATLAAAVATLPGRPWEYQAVVSIDEATGVVRRYHGFHADVVTEEGDVLVLQVANAGKSEDPSSPTTTVRYDPADTTTFYAGALVAQHVVRAGRAPGNSGAVFISSEAVESFAVTVPKLPPGAGE